MNDSIDHALQLTHIAEWVLDKIPEDESKVVVVVAVAVVTVVVEKRE